MNNRWPAPGTWIANLHAADAARAVIGGYAAAIAFWALRHPDGLADFVLKNALPPDGRRVLLLTLVIGGAAGAIAWLLVGWLARRASAHLAPRCWLAACSR